MLRAYKNTNILVARGKDGMKFKRIINLVLVNRNRLKYVYEMKTVRGLGRNISNHSILLIKVKMEEGGE